jgi:hypothetical protein
VTSVIDPISPARPGYSCHFTSVRNHRLGGFESFRYSSALRSGVARGGPIDRGVCWAQAHKAIRLRKMLATRDHSSLESARLGALGVPHTARDSSQ